MYGPVLVDPECPSLLIASTTNNSKNGAVRLNANEASSVALAFVLIGLLAL